MTRFQKAKITNCSLPFRRVNEHACSENGEGNSGNCRSLELARSLNYQVKTTNFCHVATFISNSPAETQARGARLAADVGVGPVLALQAERRSRNTRVTSRSVAAMG